ncbi:protein obstructor-E-like [Pollicipes pollicipes]|uniref:protein obstructor-E-like n=1 Tax=Pollicipes pollicipes TaxID=41117 RepID=UPI0018850F13|nr:protein obstructor-E-like [Pollicipes pollicipes]XP_037083463.1 protein obstructor-E-like [Pollicipes pollicipes]
MLRRRWRASSVHVAVRASTARADMRSLIFLAVLAVAYGQDDFQFVCPESYGDYEDTEFCDYFWRCNRGEAEPLECQDGHAFNPNLRGSIYPCDYVFKVNCTGRESLQDPQPGIDLECERQHGIYPDPELCDTYYVCKDGVATRSQCAPGLHFHIKSRECRWPDEAGRGLCDKRESLGDFSCPLDATNAVDVHGNRDNNPTYIHPDDCRLFYVCLNGVKPMEGGCPEGTVFNDATRKCDDPANVEGCENYYSSVEGEQDL